MTQHKDRKTKIRARMAADSISYTRAALLVDREAGQAPTRTIDCDYFPERYGEWLEDDDDLIHNGVWDRASDQSGAGEQHRRRSGRAGGSCPSQAGNPSDPPGRRWQVRQLRVTPGQP